MVVVVLQIVVADWWSKVFVDATNEGLIVDHWFVLYQALGSSMISGMLDEWWSSILFLRKACPAASIARLVSTSSFLTADSWSNRAFVVAMLTSSLRVLVRWWLGGCWS